MLHFRHWIKSISVPSIVSVCLGLHQELCSNLNIRRLRIWQFGCQTPIMQFIIIERSTTKTGVCGILHDSNLFFFFAAFPSLSIFHIFLEKKNVSLITPHKANKSYCQVQCKSFAIIIAVNRWTDGRCCLIDWRFDSTLQYRPQNHWPSYRHWFGHYKLMCFCHGR